MKYYFEYLRFHLVLFDFSSRFTQHGFLSYGAGVVIGLESRVTAAVRASSRPSTVAPVVTVMEAKAMMVPLNTEPVPSVAELPTCQNTLAARAPLDRKST